MRQLRYRLLPLTAVLAVACTRGQSPIATTPEPVETPAITPPAGQSGKRSWSFTQQATTPPRRYVAEERTIIELQSEGARRDSFTVSTSFTIRTFTAANQARVTGTIESITFRPERSTEQSDSLTAFPFSFAGQMLNGALVLDSAAGLALTAFTNCVTGPLNRISTVQRTLITLPATVALGQSWSDSSTVTACSGTIPVQLTTIRTYMVNGESRSQRGATLTIDRTDRIRASGEGAQGQHRISLHARGAGSARMYLDPETGLLFETAGKQRTELSVGASGRIERFIQVVEESTRLQ